MGLSCHSPGEPCSRRRRGRPHTREHRPRAGSAPATSRPSRPATSCSITATRSRWPGPYWGRPPCQRWTCAATGSAVTPVTVARSARAAAINSSSGASTTAASPNRPNEARTRVTSRSARCGHLRLDRVNAFAPSAASVATRIPEFCGRSTRIGSASATTAEEASWMSAARSPTRGGRCRRAGRRVAGRARRGRPRRRGPQGLPTSRRRPGRVSGSARRTTSADAASVRASSRTP